MEDDDTQIEWNGHVVKGWRATAIVLAIFASGAKVGYDAGTRHACVSGVAQ